MEFGAIQELAEDFGDLIFDDPGTIVGHPNAKAILGNFLDGDLDLGKNFSFLAGIERVVDRFLDRGQERFLGVVEAEEVTVLGEEFRNLDLR